MMARWRLLIFAVLFLLLGCSDNFTIIETRNGIYKINKLTGRIDKIDSYWLIRLTEKSANDLAWPDSGKIEDGYQFLGGNPADSTNWKPITNILDTMQQKPGEKKMKGKFEIMRLPPWDTTTPNWVNYPDSARFHVYHMGLSEEEQRRLEELRAKKAAGTLR
jgi:hypothetical protein